MAARIAPIRVLVVDTEARVRRALADLITATDGLTLAAAVATADEACPSHVIRDADIAIVQIRSATDASGLAYIRSLAPQLPVVAASVSAGGRRACEAAGASAFYEMDGDADALIEHLRHALEVRP